MKFLQLNFGYSYKLNFVQILDHYISFKEECVSFQLSLLPAIRTFFTKVTACVGDYSFKCVIFV